MVEEGEVARGGDVKHEGNLQQPSAPSHPSKRLDHARQQHEPAGVELHEEVEVDGMREQPLR
eukprot:scaffold64567_cov34-Phaeocystis_antarctica.AAC.2